jgi:hypothetical protein
VAYYNRGFAFFKKGNISKSKADQARAIQLDPNVGKPETPPFSV